MGKVGAFKEILPEQPPERPIEERVRDYHEIHTGLPEDKLRTQAARCVDMFLMGRSDLPGLAVT